MPGRVSPTVLVASDDLALLDEIVRHLDQIPHWRLAATARSATELLEGMSSHGADAVLISDGLARDLAASGNETTFGALRLVVVGRQEHPATLRAALRLGARGFVYWPGEQRELRALVEEGLAGPRARRSAQAPLTMLWAPKGGSGASVLSAHLAAVLASFGIDCVLVDLDLDHGDQSAILRAESEQKTIVDLLRVVDEITPSVIESVAVHHAEGFRAVLSPGSPGESGLVKGPDIVRVLGSIREGAGHVIADVPSGFGELLYSVAEGASRILVVVTPDLLALRRAREAMQVFSAAGIEGARIEIVLNRSRSGEISASDVDTVLGRPSVAQIPPDVGLSRAPDRGELAPSGRRLLDPLARRIAGLPEKKPSGVKSLFRR